MLTNVSQWVKIIYTYILIILLILKYFQSKLPCSQFKKKKRLVQRFIHSFIYSTNVLGAILNTGDTD